MPFSMPDDFAFEPKVWSDHIMAYFDKTLSVGAVALRDNSLVDKPGTKKNFPYYKALSSAQKPAADEAVQVEALEDDSFECTVEEGAKGVGIKTAALMKSAASREDNFTEAQRQIGRVLAEQVEADLITEMNTSGNYESGYVSADGTDYASIDKILKAKIVAFGDKHTDAVALYLHSLHYLNVFGNSTSGFLKADANDPFWQRPGFQGRLLGMALFTNDNVPAASNIGGKKAYEAFLVKANPYGIMTKQDAMIEADKDIIHREYVFVGTQWYGVKAFHKKVAAADKRICRMTFVTEVSA